MAAIYQWQSRGGIITYTLTTTLYPVEVIEAVIFGVTLSEDSSMSPILEELLSFESVPLSGAMTTILSTHTMPTEEMAFESVPLSGAMITILNTHTMPTEEMSFESIPLGGEMNSILVTINAPVEGAIFAVTLDHSTCTMTPV